MALKDLDEDSHYWYYNAYGNLDNPEAKTVVDFQESNGEVKTGEMLQKYGDPTYGEPKTDGDYTDLWGLATLKEKVAQGWFVPSRAEWSAFGDMLYNLPEKVTTSNYPNYGLKVWYWSSSQYNYNYAWHVNFNKGYMSGNPVKNALNVLLSATF